MHRAESEPYIKWCPKIHTSVLHPNLQIDNLYTFEIILTVQRGVVRSNSNCTVQCTWRLAHTTNFPPRGFLQPNRFGISICRLCTFSTNKQEKKKLQWALSLHMTDFSVHFSLPPLSPADLLWQLVRPVLVCMETPPLLPYHHIHMYLPNGIASYLHGRGNTTFIHLHLPLTETPIFTDHSCPWLTSFMDYANTTSTIGLRPSDGAW